jgi:O-antigen/teichoic acid export membrane protein
VLLASSTLCALISLPIALHYLSKERFALWALMSSISGYLTLIDFGMSSSVARLLIDQKDLRENTAYGSLIQTGTLVLLVQGLILLLVCFAVAPSLAQILEIPANLRSEFIQLLRWQGVVLALTFLTRIFNHVLFAHQRLDLSNYAQVGTLLLTLLLVWQFFAAGRGVFSLVWSALLATACGGVALFLICFRLRFFPARGYWGKPSWRFFGELFAYGKDLFLVAFGGQLIMASQTMIITRRLGLEQAAVWAVGTRAFGMVNQLVWRLYDSSAPAFGEMLARRETGTLLERYRIVFMLSCSFAAFCAATYALCNSPFVTVWMAGKIVWPPFNDLLLAIWMVVSAIVHSHNSFIGLTKEIGFMRYVFFVEGAIFVVAAYMVSTQGELPLIIICSIACSVLFSGAYGTWRVIEFFHLSFAEVGSHWLGPTWAFLWRFLPLSCIVWFATRPLAPIARLAIHVVVCSTLGLYLLARFGVPTPFQQELLRRVPLPARGVLTRLFGR